MNFRKYIIALWILVLSPILVLATLLLFVRATETFPSFDELENPPIKNASEIYSEDGKLLGKYITNNENRTYATFDDLSKNLVNALVATEDKRFFDHSGVDFQVIPRVVIKTIIFRDASGGGGSTISQQLAKNLFARTDISEMSKLMKVWTLITTKLKEWIIATRLEKLYTKEEIISMYFNKFDFIYSGVGINSASHVYFNKPPKDLTVGEAATLVGMLKNPTYFNPIRKTERTQGRRNTVLYLMEQADYISAKKKKQEQELPLSITEFNRSNNQGGLAPYFRDYIKPMVQKWASENAKEDGTPYDIYADGLRIFTTINSKMQAHAEQSVKEHLSQHQKKMFAQYKHQNPWKGRNELWLKTQRSSSFYADFKKQGLSEAEVLKKMDIPTVARVFTWQGAKDSIMTPNQAIKHQKLFLQTGFMAIVPQTGHVKSWVGGINYGYFKYDHTNPKAKRQVGSTIKPFLYALGISERGFTPCSPIADVKFTIPKGKFGLSKDWTPENAGSKYEGMLTMQGCLTKSKNTCSAYLINEIGPKPMINFMRNMNITSDIPEAPSIALGTPSISVYEMVSAYTTFVNKGWHTSPLVITRIEDKYGNELVSFSNNTKEVTSRKTAEIMTKMLTNVVYEGSLMPLQYEINSEIGGKTGTTNDQKDGWFMGITPDIVAGCWVGNDDPFIHFNSLANGQGGRMARPIVGKFIEKLHADKSLDLPKKEKFEISDEVKAMFTCEENTDIDQF